MDSIDDLPLEERIALSALNSSLDYDSKMDIPRAMIRWSDAVKIIGKEIKRAVLTEREECAKLVDGLTVTARDKEWSGHYCAEVLAIKIRQRESRIK